MECVRGGKVAAQQFCDSDSNTFSRSTTYNIQEYTMRYGGTENGPQIRLLDC